MKFLIILVVLIGIFAFFATLAIGGKGDEDYMGSTKKNVFNLTIIYVILGIVCAIGLGYYFVFIV